MKLSIIIPVYNTEKELSRCLESCLNQNIASEQYEIIIVDDGSSDGSSRICREYEQKHPNIRFFSQENQGQSAARNSALKKAAGEYIWFVDADDWIAPGILDELITNCEQKKMTVLGFGGVEKNEEGAEERPLGQWNLLDYDIEGKDFLLKHDASTCTPLYLFKRDFLEKFNLTFLHGVYFEDEDFIYRTLYLCDKISFINKIFYYVYPRPTSTTRNIHPKKSYDLLKVCRHLSEFVQTTVDKEYRYIFHSRIALLLNKALLHALELPEEKTASLNQAFYDNRDLFRHLRKSSRMKDKLEGITMTLCPRQSMKLFKILHRNNSKVL